MQATAFTARVSLRLCLGLIAVFVLPACKGRSASGGKCSGSKACPSGEACVDGTCLRLCKGPGECRPTEGCVGGYCRALAIGCADSSDCAEGWFCKGVTCEARAPLGQACDIDDGCISRHCALHLCCDSTCDGTCMSCGAAQTGETDGYCAPVLVGLDPLNECFGSYACDGAGACALLDNGSACGEGGECLSGQCVEGVCCDLACDGGCESCRAAWTGDSDGSCLPVADRLSPPGSCTDYLSCNGLGSCRSPYGAVCGTGTDCATEYCANKVCTEPPFDVSVWTYGGVDQDAGRSVAVAPNGNIVLAGGISTDPANSKYVSFGGSDLGCGGTPTDNFVAVFTADGTHVWSRCLGDGQNYPIYAAADSDSNVIVAGLLSQSFDFGAGTHTVDGIYDLFVVKLAAADGALLWDKAYSNPSSNGRPYGLVIDSNSNAYVLSREDSVKVRKFSSSGSDSVLSTIPTYFSKIAVTRANQLVFLGEVPADTDLGSGPVQGGIVARYSSAGYFIDVVELGFSPNALSVGYDDSIAVTAVDSNITVTKLSPTLSTLWSRSVPSGSAAIPVQDARDRTIVIADLGTATSVQIVGPAISGPGTFAVAFGPSGALLWSKQLTSSNLAYIWDTDAVQLAVADNTVFIPGAYYDGAAILGSNHVSSGAEDIFLLRMTPKP